jgi:hypothetical protein
VLLRVLGLLAQRWISRFLRRDIREIQYLVPVTTRVCTQSFL